MPIAVTDPRSSSGDQLKHAVDTLAGSKRRQKLFTAIYSGRTNPKSARLLAAATKLSEKVVLDVGKQLARAHLVEEVTFAGRRAYAKDPWYAGQRDRILRLLDNPKARAKIATKAHSADMLVLRVNANDVNAVPVTIDDFKSFERARERLPRTRRVSISEESVKSGVLAVLGETGRFKDWGGERSDVFTTRLVLRGKRIPAAFALKGPAIRGKLTPAGLGKNADQIQRLFTEPADVFLVQFVGEIDSSVLAQMKTHAVAKSFLERRPVYYGAIDGADTDRLIQAYPRAFAG